MKSSLLLGLILPGLLRASDTKYFVNGTLQPVTTFSNTEDIGNLQDKKNCTNSDFVENCVSIFLKNKTTGLMTQFAMRSDEVSDFEVPKVKLRPPQNISASVIEGKLHIKWDKPDPTIRNDCFLYQLRINKDDEVTDLEGVTKAERSVDLRKSNFVEMRVTTTVHCVQNHIWSDWSAAVEVPASERYLDELNPLVVAAIALGIPMFLLAILLACRCHSRMEKLFPVPSPSMKVKELLEKDNCIQVFPKYIEETTEVLIVGND
ncbi:interleukin-5 receptor subunit alpha-like isoform X3 [Conger conger]|uniref:interleukin-5 receptor subunit alpha-like isoform X3 n=1 Tax=Conger conger TaxID=82655 RepID=UPI002A5A858E|nr:interleukin-5 receptor subunit alpha-like isoform X3 [Conger conger]